MPATDAAPAPDRSAATPSAIVLAAGHGTRLAPLTDHCPKPLVPIGDRPAIAHILDHLGSALGLARVVVNAHHRADDVVAWAAARTTSPEVVVSRERDLLGTAGGVAHAREALGADGDVLVWNGDILSELDIAALLHAHATSAALATLVVSPRPRGEGTVGIRDRRVVRLRHLQVDDETSGGDFQGIHVVGPALRATLPRVGCLVGDVYLPHLARGGTLRVFTSTSGFADIGTPAAYLAENLAWLARQGARAWVERSAHVEAEIENAVIGARATVRARIERAVVWPDAVVDAPITDAIVTPWATVRV